MNRKSVLSVLTAISIAAITISACGARNTENASHPTAESETESSSQSQSDTNSETESETPETETSTDASGAKSASDLLDEFVNNEIPAQSNGASDSSGEDSTEFYLKDLPNAEDSEEWEAFSVGKRMDLDNDGEDEMILNGPYGGMYIDAANGQVSVLAAGEGTAGQLMYADYEDKVWIVHADTTHQGREIYHLDRYNGSTVEESCELSAEYEDSPDDTYHEDSTFRFRDKDITMQDFESLRDEMFKDYYSEEE